MSNYNSLKNAIDANIKQNGNQEITGQVLNSVLNQMVTTLGAGYQFAGVATTATNPGTPDAKVFYIANGKGTYTNFGGLQVTEDDVIVLTWDSSWHKVSTGIASNEKLTELELQINTEVVPVGAGTNLLNPQARHLGYWIGANGNFVSVNENYGYYGYLEIEPNTQYFASNKNGKALSQRSGTYVAFYDKDKNFISATEASIASFTTPNNAKYVNLSFDVVLEYNLSPMLNKGTSRAFYEEFSPISKYLKSTQDRLELLESVTQKAVNFPNIGTYQALPLFTLRKGAKIVNKGVPLIIADNDQYEGRVDVATGDSVYLSSDKNKVQTKDIAGDVIFDYIYMSNDEIINLQNKISAKAEFQPQTEYVCRDIFLISGGEFETLGTFLCGWGYGTLQGMYVTISPNDITIHRGNTTETIAHGLLLEKYLSVSIDTKDTTATISILSGNGQFFQTETNWEGKGIQFATFRDSTGVKEYGTRVMKKRISSPIWMYGDSYFSYNSTYRWLYYIIQWGFLNWHANHLPGGTSGDLLPAFKADLKCGCPQYALWALGMNDTPDVDNNTPDNEWLTNTQEFLQICKDNKVTPILATTPSVPSRNNRGKNKWVRESGYRYVDFDFAVGVNENGEWTEGMLYVDGVHPTQLGARTLAMRVLVDFPEITIL